MADEDFQTQPAQAVPSGNPPKREFNTLPKGFARKVAQLAEELDLLIADGTLAGVVASLHWVVTQVVQSKKFPPRHELMAIDGVLADKYPTVYGDEERGLARSFRTDLRWDRRSVARDACCTLC